MALTTKLDPVARTAAPDSTTSQPTAADDAAAAAAVVVTPPAIAGTPGWTGVAKSDADAVASVKVGAKRVWGPPVTASAALDLSRDEFSKAPVTVQKARLGELKLQQADLNNRVIDRAAALDAKWQRASVSTKTEALREYHERSRLLDPVARRELSGLVKKSDQAQVKIDTLREKSDVMCKPLSQSCTPEETAVANEVAGKLADAREAQATVVEGATAVVDNKGLKIDRLAVTESVIDPAGEARGGLGDTLLELVDRYCDVSSMIEWVVTKMEQATKEMKKQSEERRELIKKADEQKELFVKQLGQAYLRKVIHQEQSDRNLRV